MCLGSGGCRSSPSDMDSRKPVYMLQELRPALLERQEAVPPCSLFPFVDKWRARGSYGFVGEGKEQSFFIYVF